MRQKYEYAWQSYVRPVGSSQVSVVYVSHQEITPRSSQSSEIKYYG